MTNEQLDEIEKEALAGGPEDDGAGDIAAFLVDCRILPLVKALRESEAAVKEWRACAEERQESFAFWFRTANGTAKERDEARAEVERLLETLRQVHALAERGVSYWPENIPFYALVEIHKITKGMVE